MIWLELETSQNSDFSFWNKNDYNPGHNILELYNILV